MDTLSARLLSFEGYTLDLMRCTLLRGSEEIALRPKAFDVLRYLVEHPGRLVTKEELIETVWPGVFVTDDSLVQCIGEIRDALKDDNRRIIKTVPRRGYLFAAELGREGATKGSGPAPSAARPLDGLAAQKVVFCQAADGAHLAVAEVGEGPPVVKIGTWLTHVERDWQSPVWSPLLTILASRFRLIHYDARGCGLSTDDICDFSFDAMVADLEAVPDALSLEQFALLGISRGAPVAIAYAARHPDRVSRLVLHGGYPLGRRRRGAAATQDALVTLLRDGWDPALADLVTARFLPGATDEEKRWLNEIQRATISSEGRLRVRTATGDIDVTQLLSAVTAPTLVSHCSGDAGVPFEMGLMIARGIPHARFMALESQNHLVLSHEPAWKRFTHEVCNFLAGSDAAGQ